jgi:Flagellar hook-length control protein FliK
MQVIPATSSPLAAFTGSPSATARLVAGDAASLPIGALLAATVTKLENNEATLSVAGKLLTIRTGLSLAVGDSIGVTIAPNGQLEIARPAASGGPGARVVPVAGDPALDAVQTILREEHPPALGESLPTLRGQIADQPGTAKVGAVLDTMLPDESRPANADELNALVANGGQFLEAKLERRAMGERVDFTRDLKAVLLELVAAAPHLMAARATLDGIEHQQAANALAQLTGGAFVVPIPFPDGARWRTLHLAIEPDEGGPPREDADGSRPFRMHMHVPLAELGETYVEAGVEGTQVRAVFYLESPTGRERLRAVLPELEAELQSDGFDRTFLDVRPAGEISDRRRRQADAMASGRTDTRSVLDVRV